MSIEIYDIRIDGTREATQEDINDLTKQVGFMQRRQRAMLGVMQMSPEYIERVEQLVDEYQARRTEQRRQELYDWSVKYG